MKKIVATSLLLVMIVSISFAQVVPGGAGTAPPPKDGSVPNNNSTTPPATMPDQTNPNQNYPGQNPDYPDQSDPNNPTYNKSKYYGSTGKTPEERAESLTQKMKRELSLNTVQTEKVRQINIDKMRKLKQAKDRNYNDTNARTHECKKIRQEWETDLKTILSPTQWKKYQTKRQQMINKEKDHRAKAPKQGNKSAEEIEEEIEDEIEGKD